MRIAQIAPLYESVPPKYYGGTERVVSWLTEELVDLGHDVVVVSGPVAIDYPRRATIISIVSTDELLDACRQVFPDCDGLIGAAAPCDYRPIQVQSRKIAKTGGPLTLHLVETPGVVATLGAEKQPHQWLVGFALETDDLHFRAITKLEKKRCDLIVLNGPAAIKVVWTPKIPPC